MEDRRLPITVGQGAGARVVTLDLPPFTLVGATTRAGLLTTPLRDRFGIQHRLEPYAVDELARIVRRSAAILERRARATAAPRRSRRAAAGTPRVANRLLKRVRDFAEVRVDGRRRPTRAADAALELLEVDERGPGPARPRDPATRSATKFGGGPVGLSTLAVAVGEERDTIEDVYEPYLLQRGLIKRTPRGRAATARRVRAPRACRRRGRRRRALLAPSGPVDGARAPSAPSLAARTLSRSHGAPLHLPQLRQPHHREPTAPPASRAQPQGLREVRLRVPVRAARRLLPGARRGVLRLRRRGPGDRLRRELLRAHRPRGGATSIGQRVERGARACGSPTATTRSRPCWSGACARSSKPVAGRRPSATSPARATADMFPAYDDDGGLLLVLTPDK